MSKADPRLIVRADAAEFADWLCTESGFLEGLVVQDDATHLKLERYQRNFLDRVLPNGKVPTFRVVNKSRQVGFSFIMAAESLARSHLQRSGRGVHVSYNLSDAKMKIVEARRLYEGLPLKYRKKLVTDSKTELAFEAHGTRGGGRTTITSLPAKAPRGTNGDVYLDEIAHCMADREIYEGATALVIRSGGQLTMASTPLGRRGLFYEVYTGTLKENRYENFERTFVPWWYCERMCNDIHAAVAEAPFMTTLERVERFATPIMAMICNNMTLESFQQEYEGDFSDDAQAYYSNDLVQRNMKPEHEIAEAEPELMLPPGANSRLIGGVDIGRTTDKTVVWAVEQVGNPEAPTIVTRYRHKMVNVPFREQEAAIGDLLKKWSFNNFRIDETGIGKNLAENLAADFPVVTPVTFTNANKERMAINVKLLLQQGRLVLPSDRDLKSDINSIRRRVSGANNVIFDAARTKDGHADQFWALALACDTEAKAATGTTLSARFI